jgi:hypothetical protein
VTRHASTSRVRFIVLDDQDHIIHEGTASIDENGNAYYALPELPDGGYRIRFDSVDQHGHIRDTDPPESA